MPKKSELKDHSKTESQDDSKTESKQQPKDSRFEDGAEKVTAGAASLGDAANQARVRANEVFQEVSHELMASIDLRGRIERNPYGVVATVVGIGFVLGGGLFSRFTGRLVGAAIRMGLVAALPTVQKQMWTLAMGDGSNAEEVTDSREPPAPIPSPEGP